MKTLLRAFLPCSAPTVSTQISAWSDLVLFEVKSTTAREAGCQQHKTFKSQMHLSAYSLDSPISVSETASSS